MDTPERRLGEYMRKLPLEQPLHLWRKEEAPQMLALEPDAYQDKVFRFFLDSDPAEEWWVSGTVYLLGGRLVIGRLTVEPNTIRFEQEPPVSGIGSRSLRGIKLANIGARVLKKIRDDPERLRVINAAFPEHVEDGALERAEQDAEAGRVGPRRGRPPNDELLEQIARDAIELDRRGRAGKYRSELAPIYEERLGRPVSPVAIRDLVQRARARGFLAPGIQGKAKFEPGHRLAGQLAEEIAEATPSARKRSRRRS